MKSYQLVLFALFFVPSTHAAIDAKGAGTALSVQQQSGGLPFLTDPQNLQLKEMLTWLKAEEIAIKGFLKDEQRMQKAITRVKKQFEEAAERHEEGEQSQKLAQKATTLEGTLTSMHAVHDALKNDIDGLLKTLIELKNQPKDMASANFDRAFSVIYGDIKQRVEFNKSGRSALTTAYHEFEAALPSTGQAMLSHMPKPPPLDTTASTRVLKIATVAGGFSIGLYLVYKWYQNYKNRSKKEPLEEVLPTS